MRPCGLDGSRRRSVLYPVRCDLCKAGRSGFSGGRSCVLTARRFGRVVSRSWSRCPCACCPDKSGACRRTGRRTYIAGPPVCSGRDRCFPVLLRLASRLCSLTADCNRSTGIGRSSIRLPLRGICSALRHLGRNSRILTVLSRGVLRCTLTAILFRMNCTAAICPGTASAGTRGRPGASAPDGAAGFWPLWTARRRMGSPSVPTGVFPDGFCDLRRCAPHHQIGESAREHPSQGVSSNGRVKPQAGDDSVNLFGDLYNRKYQYHPGEYIEATGVEG